jgi:hypothetical protein
MTSPPMTKRLFRATALVLFALAFAGCGSTSVLLRTRGTVIGLAFHGNRLAWVGGECRPHLFLRDGGRQTTLPLPRSMSSFECFSSAQLVLAGANVGWLFVDDDAGGQDSSFTAGASSARPLRTTIFAREWYAIDPPVVGKTFGGLAADGGRVLWGWAHVSLRDPKGTGTCDLSTTDPGCQTRVDGGGIASWSASRHTGAISELPPAAGLAADRGWLAVVAEPRSGWSHGGPAIGPLRVVRLRDRVVLARVPPPTFEGAVALSHDVLAVQTAPYQLALYELPSGTLLRRVTVRDWTTGPLRVAGTKIVVQPDQNHLILVDSTTGRLSQLAAAAPYRYSITAVATDGSRVAWSVYDRKIHRSVVRVRDVG